MFLWYQRVWMGFLKACCWLKWSSSLVLTATAVQASLCSWWDSSFSWSNFHQFLVFNYVLRHTKSCNKSVILSERFDSTVLLLQTYHNTFGGVTLCIFNVNMWDKGVFFGMLWSNRILKEWWFNLFSTSKNPYHTIPYHATQVYLVIILELWFSGEALLSFKRLLQDPGGQLSNWNENDLDPCNWSGIRCQNATRRVFGL